MEFQRAPKSAPKEQPRTPSSSLLRASLNRITAYPLLQLQQTTGSQATLNMLRSENMQTDTTAQALVEPHFGHDFSRIPIHSSHLPVLQTKLTVNRPGDVYEQEADRIADQVLAAPVHSGASVAPQRIQGYIGQATGPADTALASVDQVLASSGGPLDPALRQDMEQSFGHDFSQVRVHTDARAAESAQAVNARAYTVGRNVVFDVGQYAPGTRAGQKLLAHELTHVVQQSAVGISPVPGYGLIQRAPVPRPKPATGLELPWTQGNVTLFEVTDSGIRVLVGVEASSEKTIRVAIPSIARRIVSDNVLIKDAAFQVKTCFIVPTSTRFALFKGKPVLVLDPSSANSSTAAHEMGHAVFHYIAARSVPGTPDASKAENFRLRIADLYHQLDHTKAITIVGSDGKKETHAVGHWMIDPSQWKPGSKFEHPWDDPDEFFASAKEAYQVNRAALIATIARFTKIDSRVRVPAKELLDLLDAFLGRGNLPSTGLPKVEKAAAEGQLKRATGVSKVEETVIPGSILDWLLNPDHRLGSEEAKPSVSIPSPAPKRTGYPNLVTGPGGVVEQMEERFRKRSHEKILESAEEIP